MALRVAVSILLTVLAVATAVESVEPIKDPIGSWTANMIRRLAEATLTKSKTAAMATASASTATGSPGSRHNILRFKLSSAVCPTAEGVDKELLACKNFEISHRMKAANSDAEKKSLADERKKLYAAAAAKTPDEKKKASAATKAFFTKAYASYCSTHATSETCTNEEMKRLYAIKVRRAKKA